MNENKIPSIISLMVKNQAGAGIFIFVILLIGMILAGYFFKTDLMRNDVKAIDHSQNLSIRTTIVDQIIKRFSEGEQIIWNLKVKENEVLQKCLQGPSSGLTCDESKDYGLSILSPSPTLTNDGTWSPAPSGHVFMGVPEDQKVGGFFGKEGRPCPSSSWEGRPMCPYQVVSSFIPYCHGARENPLQASPPSTCSSSITGLMVIVRLRIYQNGQVTIPQTYRRQILLSALELN